MHSSFSPLIQRLIGALRCLPGVGPKTAQRMAFHLLQRHQEGARVLATTLVEALNFVRHCDLCRMLCEETLCGLCSNTKRDRSILCVVENPADVLALEETSSFRGVYFVLMGRLSPLDGIGPEELGINLFRHRLATNEIKEIILATNPTVEGEATAHYLAEIIKEKQIPVTRIASGVPFGGELEYLDGGTLIRALSARAPI